MTNTNDVMRKMVRRIRRARFGKGGLLVVFRHDTGRLDCWGFATVEKAAKFAATKKGAVRL